MLLGIRELAHRQGTGLRITEDHGISYQDRSRLLIIRDPVLLAECVSLECVEFGECFVS